MPAGYLPILLFLVLCITFPVVLLIMARLVRPSSPQPTKLEAYECGIPAVSTSRGRHSVRFYVVAILFVVFDVEAVFLYPWAVRYRQFGWFGVAEASVFLGFALVAYLWAYRKRAFEWV